MDLAEIILIASGLLTLSMLAAGLFRNISIPYSVVLVLIGLVLSELGQVWQPFEVLHEFRLTPPLVFFVLLPALIFESGLGLNARQLLKDIAPVLSMAIPALLISSFLIGFGLWLIVGIPYTLALLFGALISATDPVAVIALFKELGAPLRLNVLIEGESLLNDATAIVLFGIILSMLLSGDSVTLSSGLLAVVKFIWVFVGGAVVGMVMGLLISELLQRLHSAVSEILVMSMVLAYASFILAEHWLHVSGVMATLSAAITLNVFGLSRIEQNVKPALLEIWKFVALVANSMLFMLVGLSINTMQLLQHSGIIAIAVLVVLLARAAAVYSMVPLSSRLFHLPKISLSEQNIMWWGGLKGGLAIAIVLSIPESLAGRDLMINMTLGVVLFSLLVNATTIRPLMRRLKMDRFDNDEKVELQRGLQHAADTSHQMLSNYQHLGVMSEHLSRQIAADIENYFVQKMPKLKAGQGWREVYLTALRTESSMLDQLFETALISQYTLLDLRNSLSRDRDNLNQMQSLKDISPIKPEQSFFIQLERAMLKFLREKNWTAGFLSAYQNRRLQQRVERDIASIVLTRSVIDMLEQRGDFESSSRSCVLELYQLRFTRWSERLDRLRREFTIPFELLEQRMFSRSSLKVAELNALEEFHHGEIGVKAFNRIESLITNLLNKLKNSPLHMDILTQRSIASVPLFSGLSNDALRVLTRHVTVVSFMPGDIIIGEGEGGDALYIIQHGEAEVSKGGKVIACIEQGHFFGEKGLLGNHVRSATVTAKSMLSLLRLSRRDILTIADSHKEIRYSLQRVRDERQHQNEG